MHSCIHSVRQAGFQSFIQAGREADRQAGRQADTRFVRVWCENWKKCAEMCDHNMQPHSTLP